MQRQVQPRTELIGVAESETTVALPFTQRLRGMRPFSPACDMMHGYDKRDKKSHLVVVLSCKQSLERYQYEGPINQRLLATVT